MKKLLFLSSMLCLILTSCAQLNEEPQTAAQVKAASTKQQPDTKAETMAQKTTSMKAQLASLPADFLFMAAQRALDDQKDQLALELLRALLKKDPEASLPRQQIIELYLKHHTPKAAEEHIHILLQQAPANSEQSMQAQLLQARFLQQSNHSEQAIQLLQTLLNKQPLHTQAQPLLIKFLIQQQRYQEAHQELNIAIKKQPNPHYFWQQTDLYIQESQLNRALETAKAFQQAYPKEDMADYLLSHILLQQGKIDEAEQSLYQALRKHPNAQRIQQALLQLLLQRQKTTAAIELVQHKDKQQLATAHDLRTLGELYYQTQQYPKAIKALRRSLAKKEHPRSSFYLALSLEAAQKTEQAIQIYAAFKQQHAYYLEAQIRLAGIEFEREQNQAGLKRLRELIKQIPQSAKAYTLLSSFLLYLGDYQALLDETEAALQLKHQSSTLLFNRAIAFEHFKNIEGIEQSLIALLKHDPQHANALNFLAYSYAERGIKLHKAKQLAHKAVQLEPHNAYYLDSLAWVYYQQKDYPKALHWQQQAMQYKTEEDATLFEHLGDILWQNHQIEKARQAWQQGLALKGDNRKALQQRLKHGLGTLDP